LQVSSWAPVPQAIIDTATQRTVTLPLSSSPKVFFRLRRNP
jgi:hypothetical protein